MTDLTSDKARTGEGLPSPAFNALLERHPPAADQLQDEHDERDHEQEMDERASRRQGHDAKQPKDEKDQNDGPQHGRHLLLSRHWLARSVP